MSIDEGDTVSIMGGFRIRRDVVEDADSLNPTALLKALANRVGEDLNIGGSAQKFIDYAQVRVPRMDFQAVHQSLNLPEEGQPWVYLGSVRFRKSRYDEYVAELKDFFCINRFKYLKWMRERRMQD